MSMIEVEPDARVDAVARALLEQERAADPVGQFKEDWPDLNGADRGTFRLRAAALLEVADNF